MRCWLGGQRDDAGDDGDGDDGYRVEEAAVAEAADLTSGLGHVISPCSSVMLPAVPETRSSKSTRARPAVHRAGWLVLLLALQQPHVGGLGALRSLRDVELDGLPLSKRAVAGRLDRAEMHEDVFAGLGGDEAEALVGVEPLHGSNSHVLVPPSIVLEVSITPGRGGAGGKGQARPAGCEAKREPLPGHDSMRQSMVEPVDRAGAAGS